MRVTIGLVGILGVGLSVTVALAQGPEPVRGARLLPPQPLEQAQTPTVARGAADDLPLSGNSTPATRPGNAPITGAKPAGGPAWLNGTGAGDANVRPAAGTAGGTSHVRPLTPKEDLSGFPKGIDKMKGPQSGPLPAALAADPRNVPTATTPFQGTAANGQPVYAGPPAYRWYGWGSVTPGANPLAPSGRYPNASANWYSITGATPGAFPVPVMNPSRPAPGTEPPAYVNTAAQRRPAVSYATPLTYQQPAPTNTPAAVDTEYLPPPTIIPPQRPLAHTATHEPARPVTVPTIAPPPGPGATPMMPDKEPLGSRTDALPVAPSPPATEPVPLPALPTVPAGSVTPANPQPPVAAGPTTPSPSPLPVSVTEDQKWQPGNARPATNEWNRGGSPTPLPVRPQSRGNEGAATAVARGQIGESQPDPTATLIRRLCESRACGVDIRWTGTKKLTVCFDCPTATEARKLVEDISGRPELTAYQIDFRVLVK